MKFFPIKLFTQHSYRAASCLVAVLLLSACASAPPQAPTVPLNAARNAIENAEQDEARQHAGAELQEARDLMSRAERAVEDERMVEAERLALQARVAAELATARTESAKATAVNRDMEQGLEALEEEMRRQEDQR